VTEVHSSFKVGTLNKLAAAYVKCTKIFFGCHRYANVTCMLLDLGPPRFNTVLFNASVISNSRLTASVKVTVRYSVRM